MHLLLPGWGENGPTLEIFSYNSDSAGSNYPAINDPGFGHIAFSVDNVDEVVARIIDAGGGLLGSIVRREFEGIGTLTVAYCTDPERNFIEIQHWSEEEK